MPKAETKPAFSKVSGKYRTVLPSEVREQLRVKPGDTLRYVFDARGVRLEKVLTRGEENPFVTFNEWSGDFDEVAYADL
jgi:antitoxin PrlF